MEPQIRYTTTEDGASIAYATMGSGPVVVMTPAMHRFAARWRLQPSQRELMDVIARQFTLVVYDGRGMGMSSREHRDYSLNGRLLDLEAILRANGIDTCSFLGPIYGGFAAIAYAARHPDRVEKLVLSNSTPSGERWFAETPAGRFNAALAGVTLEQWESVSEAIAVRVVVANAGQDAVRDHGRTLRETWRPEDFLAHREALRKIDVTNELPAVQAPTLVIASQQEDVFDLSRDLAAAIPNARLHRITTGWVNWGTEHDYAVLLTFLGGEAPAAQADGHRAVRVARDSSVRTVLFTDLVGHTEMMQRLGDARGREVLREHERITRETLAAHGGVEVKTDGDSFMASFASVAGAVECAIALQRAFAAREGEPLRVRMGLNAGEPIEDGGDLFGSTVILAARIRDRAEAGEILVPDTVRGLLSGKGFVFADRGEFVPKGFEDGLRLYEVRWQAP